MRRFSPFLLAAFLALTITLQAKDAAPVHYVDANVVDLKTLLHDPPAPGSAENNQDIRTVLQEQQARTPADVKRIKSEVAITVFVFADVLGPWFNEHDLPVTARLFKNVADDDRGVVMAGKKYWGRPRPPRQDPRIHAAIDLPGNASYPSGHATLATLDSLILVQLAPDLKDKLLARGRQIGADRILAGVHFPTDVAAGELLGQTLYAKFAASPAFQADLAKAKAEVAAARKSP